MFKFQATLSEYQLKQIVDALGMSSHEWFTYTVNGEVHTVKPKASLITHNLFNNKNCTRVGFQRVHYDYSHLMPLFHRAINHDFATEKINPFDCTPQLEPPFITKWVRNEEIKLRPYQKEFAERMRKLVLEKVHNYIKFNGFYLQDDAGLGKTIQAIEAALQLWDYTKINRPIMVIVPKTVKLQFRDEIKKYCKNVRVTTIWDEDFAHQQRFFITHYEDVRKNYEEYSSFEWLAVIPDEAHRLRNTNTQIYEAINYMAKSKKVKWWIFMSATPYHNNPAEQWGVLNIINPEEFISYWRFESEHTKFTYTEYGKSASGIADPYKLATVLKPYVMLRRYEEVAPDVPELVTVPVPIEMNDAQKRAYQKIRRGTIVQFDEGNILSAKAISNALSAIMRRRQIVSYPAILQAQADSAKLEWLDEFIEDRKDDGKQAIIFCSFQETAQMLQTRLLNAGVRTGMLIGGMKESVVDMLRTEFESREIQFLVAIYETGGAALSFPACEFGVAYDPHWSTLQTYQAMRRIQRINIKIQKIFYFLLCAETIDELMYESVEGNMTEQSMVKKFLANQDKY